MSDTTSAPRFAPHIQTLLDNVRRAGFPPLYEMSAQQARLAYQAGVGAMTLPAPEVARTADFQVPGPAGTLRARLWADSHDADLPVFLYLHGGGFVVGSIETCEALCRTVARQAGVAVVAVEYRLSPENKYPDCLADSWAAFRWLVAQGHTLGLDGRRIAVGGDSAGGTLTAAVALLARDAGIPLALQAMFYPSVQTRTAYPSFKTYANNTLLNAQLMKWFETQTTGGQLAEPWHREPMYAPRHAGLAPAWIGLAECDTLADEGRQYAQTLRDAGVPVELREWPGVLHDFINMNRFVPEGNEAHAALATAVKGALRPA
jgi:acetyl esterase